MSTQTPSQKIQQHVDNQQFEIAYHILVEEQKKIFEAAIDKEEFRTRGKELIETFLQLTYPIDSLTLDVKLELECCLRAKEIHEQGWDEPDDLLIRIYNYTGYILNSLRLGDEARTTYEYILKICDNYSTQLNIDKMEAYHGIAFAYEEEEEFEMALRYLKQAELYFNRMTAAAPDTSFVNQEGGLHNAFGSLYTKMKRYDEAIEHLHISKAVMTEPHPLHFFPSFNLARNLYYKKEYQASIDIFEKIKEKLQGSPDLQSRFLVGLSDSYIAIGHDEKAENILLEGADVFENTDMWHPYIRIIFSRLAELYLKKNNHTKAAFFIEKSLESCKTLIPRFRTLLTQAEIQLSQNQYFNALETFQKADLITDQIRRSYKTQASRLLLAEQAKDLYECSIETTFLLYKKTKNKEYIKMAFRFAEKSKAILLLHEVKHLEAMLSSDIPAEILKREKDILIRLNYIEQLFGGEKKIPEKAETKLKEERFNLHRELNQLIEDLEQNHPDYHQQKYNTEPTTISDLQSALSDNQTLISYFMGEKFVYIFSVNRKGFEMQKLADSEVINEQVSTFNQLIIKPFTKSEEYAIQAYKLYQSLLSEAFKDSPSNQLIILPDGILTQLPFETLTVHTREGASDFHQLSYLIHEYEVSYHFSATLWHYGRKKEVVSKARNFVGFAPIYAGKVADEQITQGNYRSCVYRGATCHKLPFAKKEVEEVARCFDENDVILYIDGEASKANFISNSTSAKYLHIAAHGFYSTNTETGCYIQFSPNENNDTNLTIRDIQTLRLHAHLVVLSCCNTGRGAYKKGESMLALNRSFVATGVQNVISTMFKIPDALAAELMIGMYKKHLNEGQSISPALRQAKRDLIANKDVTPIAWCGYQLIGN